MKPNPDVSHRCHPLMHALWQARTPAPHCWFAISEAMLGELYTMQPVLRSWASRVTPQRGPTMWRMMTHST